VEQKQNFFNKIFHRSANKKTCLFSIDNARCTLADFYTYSVFNSPEIQVAINFIAEIFSTIPTYHRRTNAQGEDEYLEDNIHNILNVEPNSLQNRTQFWVSAITQLLKNNNLIIYPEWTADMRTLLSITPLPLNKFFPQKNNHGEYIISIDTTQCRQNYNVSELIILNKFNTLSGGGNNTGISIYEQVMQESMNRAIEQLKNPKDIQAYIKLTNYGSVKSNNGEARAKEVLNQIVSGNVSANGFTLPFIQGDVDLKTIDIKAIPVDKNLLDYAKNIVYNYFGLTDRIIQRQVSNYEWQIWIATTIAPLARQCEEEFSRKLFTPTQRFHGNWIEFDLSELIVATLAERISYAGLVRLGTISNNEAREKLHLGKKQNRYGDTYVVDLNTVPEDIAREYQMTKAANGTLGGAIQPIQQILT
jgi:HK97 family phage portal protein